MNRSFHRPGRRWPRGVASYYLVICMVALCGICSLGVDLGRVQLVKTELRRAADAAARAGASGLPDVTQATSLATQYAQLNKADGSPVALDATDIELGTWSKTNKTFTVLTGAARSGANAVRVTARRTAARGNATPLLFAKVVGANSCDANVSAIAMRSPPLPGPGIVGIDGITMKGGDHIDSYDSSKGSYGSQTPGANDVVASNGPISMNGSSSINGDVYFDPADPVPTGNFSGTAYPLEQPLSYPPATLPATYTNHGIINLGGGSALTLAAGNHVCSRLSMSGSAILNVTGAVKLYVTGDFSMDGNSQIALAGNLPANLEIYVVGSGAVNLGKNNLYAVVYAPQSVVTMSGNCDLFGSIVAKSILMNGNNTIHYDESLTQLPKGPGKIVLVK
jgi:Flp pilus assembly protein TadG